MLEAVWAKESVVMSWVITVPCTWVLIDLIQYTVGLTYIHFYDIPLHFGTVLKCKQYAHVRELPNIHIYRIYMWIKHIFYNSTAPRICKTATGRFKIGVENSSGSYSSYVLFFPWISLLRKNCGTVFSTCSNSPKCQTSRKCHIFILLSMQYWHLTVGADGFQMTIMGKNGTALLSLLLYRRKQPQK